MFFLFSFISLAHAQWMSVSPPPVSSTDWDLFGVYFPSPAEGWAVGIDNQYHKGILLHYLNGQWRSINLPPPPLTGDWLLSGVHFTSENEGWVVGQQPVQTKAYCFTTRMGHGVTTQLSPLSVTIGVLGMSI